nr:hypothetical protein [Actinoplanes polyasparticus]
MSTAVTTGLSSLRRHLDLAGDSSEEVADLLAEGGGANDDHDGDERDEQAVLDGGRALVALLGQTLPGAGQTRLEVGSDV